MPVYYFFVSSELKKGNLKYTIFHYIKLIL